jgi:PEP-CTERM motif
LNANNPIFGDSLNLTQGGHLSALGLTLFNPTNSDNLGSIITGTMVVKFYDNTVPYVGGVLNNPLLGTATLPWDFTRFGGLAPGQFAPNYYDLTSLNIILPQNILITQQFTETSGTSIRNGAALYGNPTTGSSPDNIYIKASDITEGLYPVFGFAAQFGYQIQLVPEPTALALAGLGAAALLVSRRRK